MKKIIQFLKDEEGSNAIEYGLIASLIGLAIIAGATTAGNALSNMFNDAASRIEP